MRYSLDQARNEVTFLFGSKLYRKEALYGAALVFSDRSFVYLEAKGRSGLAVTLQGKKPMAQEQLSALAGEFHNELLNQTLRWMVAKHNRKTKEAIVAQALFAAHTPQA